MGNSSSSSGSLNNPSFFEVLVDLKKVRVLVVGVLLSCQKMRQWASKALLLTAKSVQGAALTLECVDHVHGRDGLALGVLGVGDGIPDDVLEEYLEHTSGFLVYEAGDALHAAATSEATDGRFGDALDVVTKNLAVTLGASLSESLASLATASHGGDQQAVVLLYCIFRPPPPGLYRLPALALLVTEPIAWAILHCSGLSKPQEHIAFHSSA